MINLNKFWLLPIGIMIYSRYSKDVVYVKESPYGYYTIKLSDKKKYLKSKIIKNNDRVYELVDDDKVKQKINKILEV